MLSNPAPAQGAANNLAKYKTCFEGMSQDPQATSCPKDETKAKVAI